MPGGVQATANSIVFQGLRPQVVHVEVDSARGIPSFRIVGLPEASVREARVRVGSALRKLNVELNEFVLTVNLAPAYLRKRGSAFDLAIALAVMAALERVPASRLERCLLMGELSLTGELRPIRGVLPALLGVRSKNIDHAIVPLANGPEAASIDGMTTYVAEHLAQAIDFLNDQGDLAQATPTSPSSTSNPGVDLYQVRGQAAARRALEIAATGAHHLLMIGPPGSGKSMLARRLPTILPPLTELEAIEVTAVHSVAGTLDPSGGLMRWRPFRAPHHTISGAALLGGGDPLRAGEISLAHHGCLFLDELLEFKRPVVEGMRQPLEDGAITICRARERATFPAKPLIVAAVNPCPCGYAGDTLGRCRCSTQRVQQYRGRLSGPLLDRIDLHIGLPPVELSQLQSDEVGESSETVAERVTEARQVQLERQRSGETRSSYNGQLSHEDLMRVAAPDPASRRLLEHASARFALTARSYLKLLRIARTVADLVSSTAVTATHVQEALLLRSLDRHLATAA